MCYKNAVDRYRSKCKLCCLRFIETKDRFLGEFMNLPILWTVPECLRACSVLAGCGPYREKLDTVLTLRFMVLRRT